MEEGKLQIYCGSGKTIAAIGLAIKRSKQRPFRICCRFTLKGEVFGGDQLQHLAEPEIKMFRFQKREVL